MNQYGFDGKDVVDRALENLGRIAVPAEEPSQAARRRDRVVGALGSVLGRVRARRRFVRRAWVAFVSVTALGAVALAVTAVTKLRSEPAPVVAVGAEPWQARAVVGDVTVKTAAGASRRAAGGEALQPGDVVETRDGASVALAVPSGDVRLGPNGRVAVTSTTPLERRLRVAVGSVEVDLPHKLPGGQSLIFETPDALVRVVGTAFRLDVNLDESGTPTTEVAVRRGTVWVLQRGARRATLDAGSRWRSREVVAALPKAEALKPEPRADDVSRRSARATATGTLAEENRLFEAALAARNAGDYRRAADGFAALIARYPRTVLREQSLAEQFRALDRAGQSSAAVAAARRYLAGYPEGFARADAERVAGVTSKRP